MKTYWKQILGIFVVGLLFGFAAGRCSYLAGTFKKGHHSGNKFERKFNYFSKKLDLNADQREKVKVIFEEKQSAIKELREKMRPQFKTLHQSAREEIQVLLDPGQQKKFEVLEEKMKKRREKRKGKYRHW